MEATSVSQKFEGVVEIDFLDDKLGFPRYDSGPKKVGWLVNMHSVCQKKIGKYSSHLLICFFFRPQDN